MVRQLYTQVSLGAVNFNEKNLTGSNIIKTANVANNEKLFPGHTVSIINNNFLKPKGTITIDGKSVNLGKWADASVDGTLKSMNGRIFELDGEKYIAYYDNNSKTTDEGWKIAKVNVDETKSKSGRVTVSPKTESPKNTDTAQGETDEPPEKPANAKQREDDFYSFMTNAFNHLANTNTNTNSILVLNLNTDKYTPPSVTKNGNTYSCEKLTIGTAQLSDVKFIDEGLTGISKFTAKWNGLDVNIEFRQGDFAHLIGKKSAEATTPCGQITFNGKQYDVIRTDVGFEFTYKGTDDATVKVAIDDTSIKSISDFLNTVEENKENEVEKAKEKVIDPNINPALFKLLDSISDDVWLSLAENGTKIVDN
ncbi:MAG: hypothetical protein LBD99_04230, partial [Candidatus Margulisbacteria bacterium]|nr:hypothetical protein [Candidatus Margulisiibacteriota bacterium]